MGSRIARIVLGLVAVAVLAGVAFAAQIAGSGRIGPARHMTANGRLLLAPGRFVTLGHFPTGGAVTADGRFYWTVSTGRGRNDVRIVDVAPKRPRVIQTLPLPGASGGIAIDAHRGLAYVSGVPDSSDTDQMRPHLPGRAGDVIHVFRYNRHTGRASEKGTISVPPPPFASVPQSFPPKKSGQESWPDRLAVSPNGRTLLVPLNLADAAAIIDARSHSVRYVNTGAYPYGAAILHDGKTGLVSNEGPGTVSVISLRHATKIKDIQVAATLSHPEGIAVDPKRSRAYVAIANEAQVAVIDTRRMRVDKVLSVERSQEAGENPVAVAVTPDGKRLFAAESAADELAVFALPSGTPIGRIPTLAYPADVQATQERLLWIAGKGLGAGPNRNGPNPYTANDNNLLAHPGSAVLISGRAGILSMPVNREIRHLSLLAARQVIPANAEHPPAGTPLRPNGPINHVFSSSARTAPTIRFLATTAAATGRRL
jgi:DNA-binding beta-propeller fold protein YncE